MKLKVEPAAWSPVEAKPANMIFLFSILGGFRMDFDKSSPCMFYPSSFLFWLQLGFCFSRKMDGISRETAITYDLPARPSSVHLLACPS